MANERIQFLDIFKGIGIILMIMGHVGFGEKFDVFIHAFHVPMFFFCSGMLYREKEETGISLIKRKAKVLLIPYFSFGILYTFVYGIKERFEIASFLKLFWDNSQLVLGGAIWYLTAIFITEIIIYLLFHSLKRENIRLVAVLMMALLGCAENAVLPFKLPWSMGAAFVGVGLFYAGYTVKCVYMQPVMKLKPIMSTITAVICTVLIFINGNVNMRKGEYAIIPLFWFNAIVASILIMNVSHRMWEARAVNPVVKLIQMVGENSIVYLCLNQLFIYVFKHFYYGFDNYLKYPWEKLIFKMLIFVITMLCLRLVDELLSNTKLRIFIGKY